MNNIDDVPYHIKLEDDALQDALKYVGEAIQNSMLAESKLITAGMYDEFQTMSKSTNTLFEVKHAIQDKLGIEWGKLP